MKTRKASKLKLWKDNPREIDKEAFEALKKKIERWGQFKPVLITDDGEVIGGNMRLKAYRELGIEDVWVSVVEPKDEAEKLEIAMTDNELSGRWDKKALEQLVIEHQDSIVLPDYQLDLGSATPLGDLIPQEVEEDEVPEVDEGEPVSKLGEVYKLGRHRLMCGDSTKEENVEKLMDGKKVDMVFTDPPYNIAYEGGSKKREMIKNDKVENFYQFLYDSYANMFALSKGGASFYVCHADTERVNFTKAFVDAGGYISSILIWVKNNATFGRQDYFWRHEPIIYGWNSNGSHKWYGDRKQDTVWNIDRPSRSDEHPTMKPVSLITKALKNSSKQDDIVLDLFGGSGSTLIACEQTDRTCYMMELVPKYCDVIRKRYAKLINKEDEWEKVTKQI